MRKFSFEHLYFEFVVMLVKTKVIYKQIKRAVSYVLKIFWHD